MLKFYVSFIFPFLLAVTFSSFGLKNITAETNVAFRVISRCQPGGSGMYQSASMKMDTIHVSPVLRSENDPSSR